MVKVEMSRDEEKGIVHLVFECNTDAELDTIDAIRVAMLGGHAKKAEYLKSNQLQISIKE